jgi:hypothetical protein
LVSAIKSRNKLIEVLRRKLDDTYDQHAKAAEELLIRSRPVVIRPWRAAPKANREHPYQTADKLAVRFEAMRITPDTPNTWVPDVSLLRITDGPTEQPSQDLE